MSAKRIRSVLGFLVLVAVSAGVGRAADVTPQIYVDFVGTLDGTSYTLGSRELDKTGTFAAHHGTEIVSAGLGILSDADQAGQESFQFDASAFNNNASTFAGTAFMVEAIFTAAAGSDDMAPIIDIGGQCFIRFQTGLSAGSWSGSTDNVNNNIQAIPAAGETHRYAIVYDGINTIDYYLDGVAVFQSDNGSPGSITKWISWGNIRHSSVDGGRQLLGQYEAVAFSTFTGVFDPLTDFILPKGLLSTALAFDPQPAPEADDVPRDAVLSWAAGEFAAAHDVYFGTAFSDVNDASRDNPMSVLVSEGQEDAAFDAGRLEFGRTYYWRVDEVNAAPDSTIYKGEVWSFTTEPYGYPITGLTVAASSQQATSPAIRTIDGSGLNEFDQHGTDLKTMWVAPGGMPAWIEYTFDKAYRLHELWVWNSNSDLETLMGFGAKDVTVEYSTDGETWAQLEGVPQFAQGPAKATYTPDIIDDFGGVMAKYVKLTISDNWGTAAMVSLSEVRFFYVPMAAREPVPESGAVDVLPDATLSWRAGREAESHQVFLGTDADSLSLVATVDEPGYDADLNLGQTYFWKVVEVNQAEAVPEWESNVWSFSTVTALVVDDFESYADDETAGTCIYQAWIDGYEVAANGSTVGYGTATNGTFSETAIVHNGRQSMPFFYNNSDGATIAEATRTFGAPQDWTKHGYQTLSLAFYGDPNNAGTLYLKINNTKVPYNGDAGDIKRTQWLPWNIDLASTGASLKSVTKLVIGIEGAGAAGTLYFDDIELQGTAPEFITPADPGASGLVAWYKFDGDLKDAAGTHHGTAAGDAKTATDATRGQVLVLDGIADGVDVPALGSVTALTIAMWVDSTIDPVSIEYAGFFHSNGWAAGDLHWRYSYGVVDSGIYNLDNTTGTAVAKANQWNHVAITISDTEWALWLNGYKEGSQTLAAVQTLTLGDGMIGAWLGTDGTTISRGFTGKIDDARFYNRALSQEEIGSLAGRTTPFAKPF
ncbi:MAG: LamG-like jellyroll fold domain-containing protein [Phycisphaerales bacterium]